MIAWIRKHERVIGFVLIQALLFSVLVASFHARLRTESEHHRLRQPIQFRPKWFRPMMV